MNAPDKPYVRWKHKQRELDALERELRERWLEGGRGPSANPARAQLELLERLRAEVDALMPAAMRDLEADIGARLLGRVDSGA